MIATKWFTGFQKDWGELLSDFVIKKDLDSGEWANCWDEDYNWSEFDKWIIENYEEELVAWGVTRWDITEHEARTDLKKYYEQTGG